jgi:hypothetical protein
MGVTMRVVQLPEILPAVIRIRTSRDLLIAIPSNLPPETVLTLARLVLTSAELTYLQRELATRGLLDTRSSGQAT